MSTYELGWIQTHQGVSIPPLQPNVMALNRKRCGNGLMLCERQPGTHRPMIQTRILSPQTSLEAVSVLAEIVLLSGETGLLAPGGRTSVDSSQAADVS
jgi:hypothetical protein